MKNNKINSIYNIGNYSINLSLAISDEYIAIIEIYTQDGIFVTNFKMSLITAKLLYKYLYGLCYSNYSFYYDIPIYNMSENVEITGEYSPFSLENKEFTLSIIKENINDISNKFNLSFSFNEFDELISNYFDDLLFDYVDDNYIDEVSNSI